MIIRTITAFDKLSIDNFEAKLNLASKFLKTKKEFLNSQSYQVQTIRFSTQLWEDLLALSEEEILKYTSEISKISQNLNIDFINLGTVNLEKSYEKLYRLLPQILKACPNLITSAYFANNFDEILWKRARVASEIFLEIVKYDFESTFRFGVQSNCQELIPFYPASFYRGDKPKYAIGCQLTTSINQIADFELEFDEFFIDLSQKLNEALMTFEKQLFFASDPYEYSGIDTSFACMVDAKDSIARIYENVMKNPIGDFLTLSTTAKFTNIMKNIDVKKTGFCGMMLPILEDSILAQRFSQGSLDIQKLMFYSTVCACGIDTLPVSSQVSIDQITRIYLDSATIAFRHNKPQSVRLMSIPNSKPGDMTNFNNPYTCNTKLII